MKNLNITKKLSSFAFLFMFLSSSILTAFANQGGPNAVTDRELLLLSLMSFKDSYEEDVSLMGKDTKFNERWFGDYTTPAELKDWKTVDYEINADDSDKYGFNVVTFKNNNNIVIAFKGVESVRYYDNWKHMISNTEHPGTKHIEQYINKLKNSSFIDDNSKVYFVGYSLGGYLCMYATGLFLQVEELKNKFVKTETFNGVGLGYLEPNHAEIRTQLEKLDNTQLVHYRVCGDVISTMGEHFTKLTTLKFIPIKRKFFALLYWTQGPHISHHFLVQEPFINK